MTTFACIAPSKMPQPQRVTSTTSSFTLSWQAPSNDGGCPVLGYAVYRNDGLGGPITTEVNSISDSNIRDKPTLRQTVITNFPANSSGKVFVY